MNIAGLLQQQGCFYPQNPAPRMTRRHRISRRGPRLEVLGRQEIYRAPSPSIGPDFKRWSSHFQVSSSEKLGWGAQVEQTCCRWHFCSLPWSPGAEAAWGKEPRSPSALPRRPSLETHLSGMRGWVAGSSLQMWKLKPREGLCSHRTKGLRQDLNSGLQFSSLPAAAQPAPSFVLSEPLNSHTLSH